MEKFKTIEQDIENVTEKRVIKQTRISGVATSLMLIAVACAVGGMSFTDPNSAVPTFLFTASAFLFLSGIIKLFADRSCYLFQPTRSRLKPVTLFFDIHESDSLQTCLAMKRFEELKQLKREKDTGVKVEAMVAGDGKFAAVQISEYIPYTYEAITPVICYYDEDAHRLAAFFNHK